jgi:PEGA domain-containing protein
MTLKPTALTAALLTATVLASAPAFAQDAHRDHKQRESARAAQERAQQPQRAQPAERAQQPQPPQQPQRAQPQREPQREQQREQAPPRADARRDDRAPRVDNRRDEVVGRAVPRTERPVVVVPRFNDRRDNDRRYDGRDRRYSYSPRYVPRTYYRPYVFRPRLSIGFGIFAGFPVPYSYSYGYPIEVYGYSAPRGPVLVGPGSPLYGGVALEIGPSDADVFVDGSYAGRVEDFDGTSQPLTLVAGTHRIEVQAPGMAPLVFDVTVQPGQVIPYRGELQPY